ncbi:MAG: hypothetical protein KDC90_18110, partial [Ignavibacteriae bacterium]|nr:hypothetical protein [Ignavibacteriota bacterium]
GILAGFAFSIKYTSFILIIALIVLLTYKYFKYAGVIFSLAASLVVVFLFKLNQFSGLEIDANVSRTLQIIFLILSFAGIAYVVVKERPKFRYYKKYVITMIAFLLPALLIFSPWLVKNYIESPGKNLVSMVYGNNVSPEINLVELERQYSELYPESVEAQRDITQVEDRKQGVYEALVRYSGYEEGFAKYATLLYDTIMHTNVSGVITDIGYVLLLFPVVVMLVVYKKRPVLSFVLLSLILMLFVIPSFVSSFVSSDCLTSAQSAECINTEYLSLKQARSKSSPKLVIAERTITDAILGKTYQFSGHLLQGYSKINLVVSFGLLFVITALIVFGIVKDDKKESKYLLIILTVYMLLWLMLGAGIYWYGMTGFVIMFVLLYKYLYDKDSENDDTPLKIVRFLAKFSVSLWIFLAFFNSFSPTYLKNVGIWPKSSIEYAIGKINADESLTKLNQAYDIAAEAINNVPDSYVFGIGTFINYHINNNFERVYRDNQLDMFSLLVNSSKTRDEINTKLKLAGFKYIVVDLNGASIDNTPDKSLTKKFDILHEYLAGNPGLKLIATDRKYAADTAKLSQKNAEKDYVYAYELNGKELLDNGNIAVFEIID